MAIIILDHNTYNVRPCTYSDRSDFVSSGHLFTHAAAVPPGFMTGVQESATSVLIVWFTPNPLDNVIGYRIYYRGPTNDTVDVDDPQTNTHLLTGLRNNASYTVFIVSKSIHLPSKRLQNFNPINLGKTVIIKHTFNVHFEPIFHSLLIYSAPGAPELQLYSATSDTLSFSWTLTPGSLVDRYEVNWSRNHTQFASFHDIVSSSASNYTVSGLSDYGNATIIITVTAFNAFGNATSTSMNIAASVATSQVNELEVAQDDSSSSDNNDDLIIGIIIAALVILAITAIIITILIIIYCYKSKSSKNSRKLVHS